ncbi:MAG: penicillin-binding transpeptidase domain-containing protein [Ignavibacteriaceae bacterium]|jgi:beta-lactamase class D
MKNLILILFLIISLITNLYSQSADSTGLAEFLNKHNTALVIYDQNKDSYIRFNSERCKQRFQPASTYKIPNALIGLETGVISDSDYVIKWDGTPQPFKAWERDHTLKSAIYYSVVPYFRELARRVGREKMQYWLNKINYGNKTIGDKEDYFWLDNSLRISADEQVEFLKKFYSGRLPFSKRSLDIVKNIMPEEDFKNAVLRYKTGTNDAYSIAWLVGYVEKKDTTSKEGKDVYFFAFNTEAKTFNELVELRTNIKNKMLVYLGVNE